MSGRNSERRALVPKWMGEAFDSAPPGHRFGMYLKAWNPDTFRVPDGGKQAAYKEVAAGFRDAWHVLAEALAHRQRAIGAAGWTFPATVQSPLATGLGMEHPLENGFAFLAPYGLPYLPGSSIKGVLRAAARELASGDFELPGDAPRIDESLIERLFGQMPPGGESDDGAGARRGGLCFLDAFPVPPTKDSTGLTVEIMTPHHGGWLMGNETDPYPHENESPNPIPFLALALECRLEFVVLPGQFGSALDRQETESVLRLLLEHAFDWLGFGAKTAVGYGAVTMDRTELQRRDEARKRALEVEAEQTRLANLDPLDRRIEEVLQADSSSDADEIKLIRALENNQFAAEERVPVAERVRKKMQDNKSWNPSGSGSSQKKKKDHNRTLAIMRILEEKS